jgi:hypothetical protein
MTIKHRGAKDKRVENARKFQDFYGATPVDPLLASQISSSRPTLTQSVLRHVEQLKHALVLGASTTVSAISDRDLYEGVKAKLTKEELSKIRFVNFENGAE